MVVDEWAMADDTNEIRTPENAERAREGRSLGVRVATNSSCPIARAGNSSSTNRWRSAFILAGFEILRPDSRGPSYADVGR